MKSVYMNVFANKEYKQYGIAVNEDRAIPNDLDGLKPVARRLLWAAFKVGITTKTKKSARIIGDCIGKFHPHGDAAAYEAMVNMINSPLPTFTGEGNFGRFSDPSYASQRYTNAKVSAYAMKVFFDPFYTPVIEYVDNYDGEEIEPVILPALLPNLLLNGTSGIGVGLTTSIPSFTLESVLKVLQKGFEKGKVSAKTCAGTLEFCTKYGATYDKQENANAILSVMEKGKGRIVFKPVYKTDTKKGIITVTGFPQHSMEKALEKVVELKGVQRAIDMSSTKDTNGTMRIELNATAKKALNTFVKKIEDALSGAITFDVKITKRLREKEEVAVTLHNSTVVQIINDWMSYRIDLEKKATVYWIEKTEEKIRYNELMRLAISKLDLIIKALKEKHTSREELDNRVAELLKLKIDEAKIITGLPTYKLSALEDEKLVQTIKELNEQKKGLENRNKNPSDYIKTSLKAFERLAG